MQGRLLDQIAKPFNAELPRHDSMNDALESLLPEVQRHSEDLDEQTFFLNRHWAEVRDDEAFQQFKLYIFREGGDLLTSTDSQVDFTQWEVIQGSNKIIISGNTLYTLSFLDEEFFILKRHGNIAPYQDRYLVLLKEPLARRMEWNEALEYLFDKYRNTNSFFLTTAIVVLVIILLLLLLV